MILAERIEPLISHLLSFGAQKLVTRSRSGAIAAFRNANSGAPDPSDSGPVVSHLAHASAKHDMAGYSDGTALVESGIGGRVQ